MAVAFVNYAYSETGSVSWTGTPTVGNCLVAIVFWKTNVTITSVTDDATGGSNSYGDSGAGRVSEASNRYAQILGCQIVRSKLALTITPNFSGAATSIQIFVLEYSGQDATTLFGSTFGSASATSGTSITSSSFDPGISSGAVIAALNSNPVSTATAGANFTERYAPVLKADIAQDWIFTSALGSITASANAGGDLTSGVILAVVIKAAGGSSHPYSGSGLFSLNSAFDRSRKVVRSGSGLFSLQQASVRSKSKVPAIGGAEVKDSASVRSRSKLPDTGGAYFLGSGTSWVVKKFWVVLDASTQVYDSGTVLSIGRVRGDGGTWVFNGGAVYTYGPAGPAARSYSGLGAYSFQSATERSRKIVRDGVGSFSFVDASGRSRKIVWDGAGVIVFRNASVSFEALVRQDGRLLEGIPSRSFSAEGKPSYSFTQEPLPARPVGQDGGYTDPTQDGGYDEYPQDGGYADIGYFKEFKPFRYPAMPLEGKPPNNSTLEGKP